MVSSGLKEKTICANMPLLAFQLKENPGTLGTLQDLRQVPELETDDIMQRKDANIDEVLTDETPPSLRQI